MSVFLKALLITLAPFLLLGLINVMGVFLRNLFRPIFLPNTGGIGALLAVAAIVVGIVLAAIKEKQKAAGVFAGTGIGIVILGASCFASIFIR